VSIAVTPHFQHRLLRQLGIAWCGVKGVDWLLRIVHSPDHRAGWHIESQEPALWDGPKFRLETRWFTEWQAYFYGTQDRVIHNWIMQHVQRDWVCFDVGMNFGFYACVCAKLCHEAHGFEPVEWLWKRAQHNMDLNGLKNLHLSQVALSEKVGTVSFYLPRTDSCNWGAGSLLHDQKGERVEVPTTTIDAYCEQGGLKRLDFIKIDVEGAEHLVLKGGTSVLRRFRPIVIFENNSDSRNAALGIFQGLGYSIHDLSGELLPADSVCTKPVSDFLAMPGPRSR